MAHVDDRRADLDGWSSRRRPPEAGKATDAGGRSDGRRKKTIRVLIEQLAKDEGNRKEADKLLLTVPNQLGVAYKAHVIEDSNPPRVGFDLWTKGASRHRDVLFMMNDMSMSRIGWRAGLFGSL